MCEGNCIQKAKQQEERWKVWHTRPMRKKHVGYWPIREPIVDLLLPLWFDQPSLLLFFSNRAWKLEKILKINQSEIRTWGSRRFASKQTASAFIRKQNVVNEPIKGWRWDWPTTEQILCQPTSRDTVQTKVCYFSNIFRISSLLWPISLSDSVVLVHTKRMRGESTVTSLIWRVISQ
jgi:hypothetical protein